MIKLTLKGDASVPSGATNDVVTGEPLSAAELQQLFGRVEALEVAETVDFRVREASTPPPLTGVDIRESFPSESDREVVDVEAEGSLQVLRVSPQGDVNVAKNISVTFNKPVVALGQTVELPVSLFVDGQPAEPKDGEWRAMGTSTLVFEPDDRLAGSTEYKVVIEAGTPAVDGTTLAETHTQLVTTQPLKLLRSFPGQKGSFPHNNIGAGSKPYFVLAFDQRIDGPAFAESIDFPGGMTFVTQDRDELEELEPDALHTIREVRDGTWVMLKPNQPIPTRGLLDNSIRLTIPKGTRSAEGKRVTTEAQHVDFEIAGAFKVTEVQCGWDNQCQPTAPWRIRFSNQIDPESFDPTKLLFDPPLDAPNIDCGGSILTVYGSKKGGTTYKITIPEDLVDMFKQPLTGNREFKVKVGKADPSLSSRAKEIVTFQPEDTRYLPVNVAAIPSVEVSVYKVSADDWNPYIQYVQNLHKPGTPPGQLIGTQEVKTDAPYSEETFELDLVWAVPKGELGHYVVIVKPEATFWSSLTRKYQHIYPVVRWVQSTRLGLSIAWDYQQKIVGWVSELASGAPVDDAKIVISNSQVAKTNASGTALFNLTSSTRIDGAVATLGDDVCINSERYGSIYTNSPSRDLRWFVFNDRGMYKPGEKVRFKGWIRNPAGRVNTDLSKGFGRIEGKICDSQYVELGTFEVETNMMGGFDFEFDLPATPNLGKGRVELRYLGPSSGNNVCYAEFEVQEFRRPEFEVGASVLDPGPHLLGADVPLQATASYFTGESLPGLDCNWTVKATPGQYQPPGWMGWTFVEDRSPWFSWFGDSNDESVHRSHSGTTGPKGDDLIAAVVEAVDPPQPVTVTVAAAVTDINRQVWQSKTSTLVHASSHYIGLRSKRAFVGKGDVYGAELIVVDIDGNPVPNRSVIVELCRPRHERIGRKQKTTWEPIESQTIVSAQDPVSLEMTPPDGGRYRLIARSADLEDRPTQTYLTVWVSGGKSATNEAGKLILIPESEEIVTGESTTLLVSAPFTNGYGVAYFRCGGCYKYVEFELKDGTYVLDVEAEEDILPKIDIDVDIVGVDDNGRPAFAHGHTQFEVLPESRRMRIELDLLNDELVPRGETMLNVTVKAPNGSPANMADVVVWVVDEAILGLSDYKTPDPLTVFYPQQYGGLLWKETRATLLHAKDEPSTGMEPPELETDGMVAFAEMAPPPQAMPAQAMSAPRSRGGFLGGFGGGAPPPASAPMPVGAAPGAPPAPGGMALRQSGFAPGGGGGPAPEPIAVRSNFDPVACYVASAVTDENGRTSVSFEVPDNLTRYRVMVAVAWFDTFFGSADTSLTVRLPVTVRPSPPRFANFGDDFEFPIVVHNAMKTPGEFAVALRADNLAGVEMVGKRVRLEANQRAEVRFPAQTRSAGEVKFQAVVDAGGYSDAASGDFPIYTPATTEAFATYGAVDEGAIKQSVEPPPEAFEQFGGIEISTSSTALQALTDSVLYLARYPFDCAEQRASRVLAIGALEDVLSAFEVEEMPSPAALRQSVADDLEALGRLQHWDGGWGFWERGKSWPIVSVHVLHAMIVAGKAGFEIDHQVMSKGIQYVTTIEQFLTLLGYSKEAKREIRSQAAFVLARGNHKAGVDMALKVLKNHSWDDLSLTALGCCWYALRGTEQADKLYDYAMQHVGESESTAQFTNSYREQDGHLILASDRRGDALMMWALMEHAAARPATKQSADALIVKLVKGLLGHRKRGRWGSTNENAYVLLALDAYFKRYEAVEPDFVARAWFGGDYAGAHAFKGRTTERHHINVPMLDVVKAEEPAIVLQKDGAGRMYYRMGLKFAPRNLDLEPLSRGFEVVRTYEGADDPDDVGRRDDGTWVFKLGARVKVTLSMVAAMRRYHVALVDPLPAGCEILNPALKVTQDFEENPMEAMSALYALDDGYSPEPWFLWLRWMRPWFEHQNFRDERAEAFTSLLWEGVHTYTYFTRATTPGEFIVPPLKAEEMYSPEVFGRGATDRVVVR